MLTPLQSASVIVAFGLLVQGYSVWKLRAALDWYRLWPFVIGAAVGVPAGVMLLTWWQPRSVRIAVGVFLVLYAFCADFHPNLKPISAAGRVFDTMVGSSTELLAGSPVSPVSS
ncbi:TSUP family transporter [Bradyrhizobium sp. STM 3562]|uniref:TSUP family transporter n=1 Tax=Bradyrhizobium sp. STM 3562 TaxID=578924 RepID=UPI003890E3C6